MPQDAAQHPNIVLILADDLGWGDLGCYGAEKIPTPNVDRLAREGARFTDAHSASAVCTPSRYALLTGRCCWRTRLQSGVPGGFGAPLIAAGRPTLASLLKTQGYRTGAFGKWHLGFNWHDRNGWPLDASRPDETPGWSNRLGFGGFDVDYDRLLTGGPCDHGFDAFFGMAGSLDMPPYAYIENDQMHAPPDRPKETLYTQQRPGPTTAEWDDAQVDVVYADKAVAFIENHAAEHADAPFFLYLATSCPHRPCECLPDFIRGASEAGDRGDMAALFDWVVGRVADALERTGQAGETLLIVTSDNGGEPAPGEFDACGHRANGPWRGKKADIHDGGHREPLIVRWPGVVPAGTVRDDLVGLVDLTASLATLTGAEIPEGDGCDMLDVLLARPGAAARPAPLIHHAWDGMFAVRMGDWKLIEGLGSGGFTAPARVEPDADGPQGQLYHLGDDPAETRNLWLERPEIVEEMLAALRQARERPSGASCE